MEWFFGDNSKGRLEAAKFLVEQCKVSAAINDNSPIKEAAREGNLELVKYLIKHGANPRTGDDMILGSACHRNCNLELVKYLVEECKLDVNSWGGAAMRYACCDGDAQVIYYLLRQGAMICHNGDYELARRIAAKNGIPVEYWD